MLLELRAERCRAVQPQTDNQTPYTWHRYSGHPERENNAFEESKGGDSEDKVDDGTAKPEGDVSLYGAVEGDVLLSTVHKTGGKKGYTDVQEIRYC